MKLFTFSVLSSSLEGEETQEAKSESCSCRSFTSAKRFLDLTMCGVSLILAESQSISSAMEPLGGVLRDKLWRLTSSVSDRFCCKSVLRIEETSDCMMKSELGRCAVSDEGNADAIKELDIEVAETDKFPVPCDTVIVSAWVDVEPDGVVQAAVPRAGGADKAGGGEV